VCTLINYSHCQALLFSYLSWCMGYSGACIRCTTGIHVDSRGIFIIIIIIMILALKSRRSPTNMSPFSIKHVFLLWLSCSLDGQKASRFQQTFYHLSPFLNRCFPTVVVMFFGFISSSFLIWPLFLHPYDQPSSFIQALDWLPSAFDYAVYAHCKRRILFATNKYQQP